MVPFKNFNYFLSVTFFLSLFVLFTISTNAQNWIPVGDKGFSNGAVWFPSISISSQLQPYVVYQDEKNNDWVSVRKYDGKDWLAVGKPGFSGREVVNSLIEIDKKGTPVVAFADKYYRGQASVMKFADTAWEYVGRDRFSTGQANFLSLALDPDGIPFVAFSQYDSIMRLQVMKFDDSVWVNVGNTDFAPHDISNGVIKFDNSGTLYVAYVDGGNGNKASVRKLNGTNWVIVGDDAFTPPVANFLCLAFSKNNTPFVSFSSGNDSKASVVKLQGNKWIDVGQRLFTSGEAYQVSLLAGKNDIPSIYYTDAKFHPHIKTYLNDQWVSSDLGLYADGIAFNASYVIAESGISYLTYVDNPNQGGISVMRSGSALPVSLLEFTGKVINQQVQLNWSTSSEINNDYFEVLRSLDGMHFQKLGVVKGKGTISSRSNYTFIDPSPSPGIINYYRLNQVDFDGKTLLSSIVSLKLEETYPFISLYPNPAKDVLNVNMVNNNQGITLRIFSANGQMQWSQKYSQPVTLIPVSVKRLAAGTYHLVIEKASGEKKTLTFIKE